MIGHNLRVPEYIEKITELAELMEEFRLGEVLLETDEFRVGFKRRLTRISGTESQGSFLSEDLPSDNSAEIEVVVEAPKGMPITSPMNGIFYGSPSPNSPAFVKEGESISAGQVVGLIEAMKVFNEIPSTVSGIVKKIVAETGSIVQPGDVLLYIA